VRARCAVFGEVAERRGSNDNQFVPFLGHWLGEVCVLRFLTRPVDNCCFHISPLFLCPTAFDSTTLTLLDNSNAGRFRSQLLVLC